ncbi:MAG: amidase [Chloroflexota bacterium]
MEYTELTLAEAARLIARHELSPLELTEAHLKRIEKLNPDLNCYLTVTADLALRQAGEAVEALRRGEHHSPLQGIPVALKDIFETRGVRTTVGSKFFADYLPQANAMVVEKIQSEGVVLLGKLNMHEIALGVTNQNPHFGDCKNPWDRKRVTGGSSGGSAAALAAGLCMGSLGTDTGGSIRIPAALCGVVGLKPTYGRVSLRGVFPLSWNLDHVGPMGRGVHDVTLLLQAMAGYDPEDPCSVCVPSDDYVANLEKGVRNWRVALANDPFFNRADTEVLEAVEQAAVVFRQLGAQVKTVEIPYAYEAAQANGLMTTSDAAAFHHERLLESPELFGADVLQRLQSGAAFTSTEYVLARRTQAIARRKFEQFFQEYDILLTPTTPSTAHPLTCTEAVERARQLTRFTAPFNLTGLPAISLPCGFSPEGLPIGLQIVSPPWAEARLLQAALAYEAATDWHLRRPPI